MTSTTAAPDTCAKCSQLIVDGTTHYVTEGDELRAYHSGCFSQASAMAPLAPLPIGDPWQEVADVRSAERDRCQRLVETEIEAGLAAGVPVTSGFMRVLHRVPDAVANG